MGGTWICNECAVGVEGTLIASDDVAEDGTGHYYCAIVTDWLKMVKFQITIEDTTAYGKVVAAAYMSKEGKTTADAPSVFNDATSCDTAHSSYDGHYGISELTFTYKSSLFVASTNFISSSDPGTTLAATASEIGPTSCTLGGSWIGVQKGEIILESEDKDGTGTYICAAFNGQYIKMVKFTIKADLDGVAYAEAIGAAYVDTLPIYSLDDAVEIMETATPVDVATSASMCCYGVSKFEYTVH
jgi:hypothetical protein